MSLQQKKNGAFRTLAGLKYMDSQEIGSIMAYAGASVPVGYLSCDGQEVSKTTYSGLYAIIGDTWGTATSADNFKLPNLNNGSFLEGGVAGTYKDAGLPNIKGNLTTAETETTGGLLVANAHYTDGVFKAKNKYTGNARYGSDGAGIIEGYTDNWAMGFDFDASRVSAIYKDDITTVQPKSACVKYCIRYMKTTNTILTLNEIKTAMVDMLYPVNSRYVQLDGMPEPTTFGGTWEVDTTYNGKALWVDSTQSLGTSISAGLPNIKGSVPKIHNTASSGAGTGAISTSNYGGASVGGGGGYALFDVNFNANSYNSIYSDSVTTVQPPAITCKVWRRTA